jgi:hypothetical protein
MKIQEPLAKYLPELNSMQISALRQYLRQQQCDTSAVTRFEVIDETGRVLVKYGVTVELSLQDDERTLKVFLNKPVKEQEDIA